ncbi:peptidyl-prolyl cis-trans isomerase [Aureococcus anophagefferens]|nr:peptidyl-prolyl cis-trans isomerase [Aureococcus anophagefferens]
MMDEPKDEPRRRRPNPTAVFETSLGTFRAEIFADRMPLTASNFLDLAQRGFYDGLHVHRVVPKMALVFGCPYSRDAFSPGPARASAAGSRFATWTDGRPWPRRPGAIVDEFPMCPRLSNHAGTLAMCNLGERDAAGPSLRAERAARADHRSRAADNPEPERAPPFLAPRAAD